MGGLSYTDTTYREGGEIVRENMTITPVSMDDMKRIPRKTLNEDVIKKFADADSLAVEVHGFTGKAYVKASNLTACAKRMGYENIKGRSASGRVYLVKESEDA